MEKYDYFGSTGFILQVSSASSNTTWPVTRATSSVEMKFSTIRDLEQSIACT